MSTEKEEAKAAARDATAEAVLVRQMILIGLKSETGQVTRIAVATAVAKAIATFVRTINGRKET